MAYDQQIPQSLKGRIIKRHGFATFFYSFLILLMAAIPVSMLFLPNLAVSSDGGATFTAMTGIENLKSFGFQPNVITDLVQANPEPFADLDFYYWLILLGLGVILCWPLLTSIIQIFKALKLMVWGQSRHMGKPLVTAFFSFFGVLLFDAGCVAIQIIFTNMLGNETTYIIGFNYIQFIRLGASLLLFIIMCIIYGTCFKHKAYLYEIDLDAYFYETVVEEITEKAPTFEVKGIEVKTTYISDHQFSKTDISYAHIPIGVTTIGNGAFSNCVYLKSLFIPRSVKNIGANAFFNCQSLQEIVYNGTKAEWSTIVRGSNWLLRAGTNIVKCKDGPISVSVL